MFQRYGPLANQRVFYRPKEIFEKECYEELGTINLRGEAGLLRRGIRIRSARINEDPRWESLWHGEYGARVRVEPSGKAVFKGVEMQWVGVQGQGRRRRWCCLSWQ